MLRSSCALKRSYDQSVDGSIRSSPKARSAEDYKRIHGNNYYHEEAHSIEQWTNRTIKCIAISLDINIVNTISADCNDVCGEGESVEESLLDFKVRLEAAIKDKSGGIFMEQSSEEFINEDAKKFIAGLESCDCKITSTSFHGVQIFRSRTKSVI